jgi:broad specificity phosphatase PhoE
MPHRVMSAPVELWLVRHGETVGGSSTRLYGSTDLELSEVGRRQMERAREAVAGLDFDRVITSPLRRSRQAAAIVHPAPVPRAAVIAAFTEIDFGHWEGLTAEEIAAAHPADHARWRAGDGEWGFPGGETRVAFRDRIASAVGEHLASSCGRSLLVLHKGVIKIILGTLLGETPAVYAARRCELGSVHALARHDGAWTAVGPPRLEHLGEHRLPGSG